MCPTHSSESQAGKDCKFTAAKTTPFLDLLSDEDKKGTEEGHKAMCFPTTSFHLYLEVTFSSPVMLLPSSYQESVVL